MRLFELAYASSIYAAGPPLHGERLKFFQAARPSLSYSNVLDSRFVLVNGDDGSVVGTVWWLRFYNATIMECVVRFSAVYPSQRRSDVRNQEGANSGTRH